MIIYLAALFILILYGISFSGRSVFNNTYMDRESTLAVNGIFVILVVFSHYSQYAGFGDALDAPYILLKKHLHQMVVATFLFYSGYGMMEQIRKRGEVYIKNLPKKAGQLLFRFDVAVLIFLAMNTALGASYHLKRVLLSLIGWKAVGNSNWYIFDILVLYILMYIAFAISGKSRISNEYARREDDGTRAVYEGKAAADDVNAINVRSSSTTSAGNGLLYRHTYLLGLIFFLFLTLVFVYVMMKAGKPTRFYNTVILMPVGCFYSEFRAEIERRIMKNDAAYYMTLLIAAAAYIFTYLHRHSYGIEGYTLWALCFISLVVLLTMKVRIYNGILEWFGRHVFSIYILQRIPMILMDHAGFIDAHKYLGLALVFALTTALALLFEKATDAVLR